MYNMLGYSICMVVDIRYSKKIFQDFSHLILVNCILCIYIFFVIQCVKARAIPCPHQLPTRGDNTVSVAQGSSGTTKQLLPRNRVFKRIIYSRSIKSRDYIGRSSSFLVCSCGFYVFIVIMASIRVQACVNDHRIYRTLTWRYLWHNNYPRNKFCVSVHPWERHESIPSTCNYR